MPPRPSWPTIRYLPMVFPIIVVVLGWGVRGHRCTRAHIGTLLHVPHKLSIGLSAGGVRQRNLAKPGYFTGTKTIETGSGTSVSVRVNVSAPVLRSMRNTATLFEF